MKENPVGHRKRNMFGKRTHKLRENKLRVSVCILKMYTQRIFEKSRKKQVVEFFMEFSKQVAKTWKQVSVDPRQRSKEGGNTSPKLRLKLRGKNSMNNYECCAICSKIAQTQQNRQNQKRDVWTISKKRNFLRISLSSASRSRTVETQEKIISISTSVCKNAHHFWFEKILRFFLRTYPMLTRPRNKLVCKKKWESY